MLELIDYIPKLLTSILTPISIFISIYYAINKYQKIEKARELARESYTFLGISIDTHVINIIDGVALVSITVNLENKGKTRITARTWRDFQKRSGNFLYGENDIYERCKHAGTIKIREVPNDLKVDLFDFYSLTPITDKQCLWGGQPGECDFEQINFLDEYEDPYSNYKEVSFWIEPNESYHPQVMVYLPQGIYVIKAIYLGKVTSPPDEEEYWSCSKLVEIA